MFSNLPLQILLYFNAFYAPLWAISVVLGLVLKVSLAEQCGTRNLKKILLNKLLSKIVSCKYAVNNSHVSCPLDAGVRRQRKVAYHLM